MMVTRKQRGEEMKREMSPLFLPSVICFIQLDPNGTSSIGFNSELMH